ncbi:MAG TPA: ABC transporter permease [Cyclobacteriaceae bacterium]|nr:ABC transporter permease [Cyclobacteriaceae bacterium]HMV09251.1 ABC transporter permease [Cyclobacteriaceae bacterium]HMX01949.1 ABC transporter permease [Cyclobacteriaceae bacterium]HMX51950.1 ABC transporter permease [Cyclobacteriaceae bacterium]HMY94772.1 ABC transporter permease [Cyclobacteriaceae bacterium]
MLRNYLTVAFRNILKDKFYSLINVFGLTLGIASCIFIAIYINDELSYDRFNTKAERIYRINEFIETEGSGERSSSVPFPAGPTIAEEYENLVETQVRLFNFQAPTILISNRDNADREFNEPHVLFADSTFFKVFDYEVSKGDKATALSQPNSVLLTESAAKRYFGDEDPIGKFLRVQERQELVVTGVMPDAPRNAHFQFDFLISFSTLRNFFGGQYPRTWYWNPCWTYLLLKDGVKPSEVENIFPAVVNKYFPEFVKKDARMSLQHLTDIHLKSDLEFELEANSSEQNIYVFTIIGVVILFIASMNFMNLSTARSAKRAKEVGLRKTLGGERSQLIFQFLLESLIIVFTAIILAVALGMTGLSWFNSLADKALGFSVFVNPVILGALALIFIVVGIGSGIYPALVLSSFIPAKVLKDSQAKGGRGAVLRKILVVVQFSLSIVMIISTVIAINQLDFLRKSDTGFNSEQVLYVSALGTPIVRTYPGFKKELEQRNDVESVTGVLDVLGSKHQGDNYRFEGMTDSKLFSVIWVGHDFFKTFDLDIVAGRAYDETKNTEDSLALIVNEALVKQMGWTNESAVGKPFDYNQYHGEIVGVVEDFNFVSKHKVIEPLIIQQRSLPRHFNFELKYVAIKMKTDDIKGTLAGIEAKWKELVPGRPFDYFFLDQELDQLYKDEEKLGKVAGIFSVLAVVVACLGLFALASFIAEERKKEIGIRKVMGGSVGQIVLLLSKDFSKLIGIAFIISCPIAWYAVNQWLNGFAFRVNIHWGIFAIVGITTFAIALLTTSYRAIQAAFSNPIKTLRHE